MSADIRTSTPGGAFERSLREFHRDVNRFCNDTVSTVTGIDQARALREFSVLGAQLQAMLLRH